MLVDASSGGEAAPARQRLSSVERRAAIVRTAIDLFAKRGFRGTTTRELALAVGVSEPVLYQHFATKRDLYTAIVDQMVGERAAVGDAALCQFHGTSDDRSFFQWFGLEVVNWYLDETNHIRLLLFSALEGHDLADIWYNRCTVQFIQVLEEYVQRRMAEGAFKGQNHVIIARAFLGMMCQYGQVSAIYQRPASELSREEVVSQFVDIFLNGICPDSKPGAR
ncbi:MAG TPA: TetR/AcrR family transcriptional regulator [Paludibaculum sp.]|jgi:AcrR family transcriptional regulator